MLKKIFVNEHHLNSGQKITAIFIERSQYVQINLESLFLMQCERDIASEIDGDLVIDIMFSKSNETCRLLSY